MPQVDTDRGRWCPRCFAAMPMDADVCGACKTPTARGRELEPSMRAIGAPVARRGRGLLWIAVAAILAVAVLLVLAR